MYPEQFAHKVHYLEGDMYESVNSVYNAMERYGVSDYVGQNQQVMGLSDDGVEKSRGMMEQEVQNAVTAFDDSLGDQWSQVRRRTRARPDLTNARDRIRRLQLHKNEHPDRSEEQVPTNSLPGDC